MQAALRAAACFAALCVSSEVRAQNIANDDVIDSGCVERGATGWYPVWLGATEQQVLVVDTDGDGLPEEAWCEGDTAATPLTNTGNLFCQNLNVMTGGMCNFTFDVWIGTAGADFVSC